MSSQKVRCPASRMTFTVHGPTLEPKGCSVYDAYCYTDPEPDVVYIEFSEWIKLRQEEDTSRAITKG